MLFKKKYFETADLFFLSLLAASQDFGMILGDEIGKELETKVYHHVCGALIWMQIQALSLVL